MGGWGGWGEGERTTEHTGEETRERGRRRKGRGQCRRTEPEALKYIIYIYMDIHMYINILCKVYLSLYKYHQTGVDPQANTFLGHNENPRDLKVVSTGWKCLSSITFSVASPPHAFSAGRGHKNRMELWAESCRRGGEKKPKNIQVCWPKGESCCAGGCLDDGSIGGFLDEVKPY